MNTCCCCFSLRAGTILIALISVICSFPYFNDVLQSWNNPGLPSPNPVRKGVSIKCSPSEIFYFEFFVPVVLSNELANILVVLYFLFSLMLLHGSLLRKRITCLPWLWLTAVCCALHICTAVVGLIQTILTRSCYMSEELQIYIVVLFVYLFQSHLISTIDNFCEQLGREIVIQSDQQNFIPPVSSTLNQPNHTIVPPAVNPHLQTVPEVVIYPNPHLDLPPSYDEVIRPTAPPLD